MNVFTTIICIIYNAKAFDVVSKQGFASEKNLPGLFYENPETKGNNVAHCIISTHIRIQRLFFYSTTMGFRTFPDGPNAPRKRQGASTLDMVHTMADNYVPITYLIILRS